MTHATSPIFPVLAETLTRHVYGVQNSFAVNLTVDISIVLLVGCMVLCIIRMLRGPHLVTRALSLDTLAIMLIGLVILLSIRLRVLIFIDGVLVLSLLSFAGAVAMAQYIARPHLRKQDKPQSDEAPRTP